MHRGLLLLVGLESGDVSIIIFRTLVRGFRYSLGDVPLVFRNILRRLLGDLVVTVCGSSRIYMQCNITFKVCT
jgi:hypothetical protein